MAHRASIHLLLAKCPLGTSKKLIIFSGSGFTVFLELLASFPIFMDFLIYVFVSIL